MRPEFLGSTHCRPLLFAHERARINEPEVSSHSGKADGDFTLRNYSQQEVLVDLSTQGPLGFLLCVSLSDRPFE